MIMYSGINLKVSFDETLMIIYICTRQTILIQIPLIDGYPASTI